MSTYTREQIRGAILAASDLFARNPDMWNFRNVEVPDCGTPGCAIGYIGYFLGEKHDVRGFQDTAIAVAGEGLTFYGRMSTLIHDAGGIGISTAKAHEVSDALRAYADKYFPEEKPKQLDPAWLAFRSSLLRQAVTL